MKYASIDIETTGTNPEIHQILEIGIVLEDTTKDIPVDQLPKFHCLVESSTGQYTGEAFPINLNKRIFEYLAKPKESPITIYKDFEVPAKISEFLLANSFGTVSEKSTQIKFHAAGKCFATFDKLFLEKLPSWKKFLQITRRVIDPAILFTNWAEDDGLPNLDICKERAGIVGEVTHVATEDAIDVIELLRKVYKKTKE